MFKPINLLSLNEFSCAAWGKNTSTGRENVHRMRSSTAEQNVGNQQVVGSSYPSSVLLLGSLENGHGTQGLQRYVDAER